MARQHHLVLSEAELLDIKLALEDCWAEFDELMRTKEWYTTELQDKIEMCLEILKTCEVPF